MAPPRALVASHARLNVGFDELEALDRTGMRGDTGSSAHVPEELTKDELCEKKKRLSAVVIYVWVGGRGVRGKATYRRR